MAVGAVGAGAARGSRWRAVWRVSVAFENCDAVCGGTRAYRLDVGGSPLGGLGVGGW